MTTEFSEMKGGRRDVYETVPIERLRVDIFRLLGKMDSSRRKPQSLEQLEVVEIDPFTSGIVNQQLREASSMLQSLEKRVSALADSDDTSATKGEYLEDLRVFNTRYVQLSNNISRDGRADLGGGGEDFFAEGQEGPSTGTTAEGSDARPRPTSPPIDKDAFIANLVEKKKNRSLRLHVGIMGKKGVASSSANGNRKLTPMEEIKRFRRELQSNGPGHGSPGGGGSAGDVDSDALREAQIEQILDAARVLKEQAIESKEKVSSSKASLESVSENLDKMRDKTGKLNKKTKASLAATWDILKLQMYILFFSVAAVVGMFFVIRIFPKQF